MEAEPRASGAGQLELDYGRGRGAAGRSGRDLRYFHKAHGGRRSCRERRLPGRQLFVEVSHAQAQLFGHAGRR